MSDEDLKQFHLNLVAERSAYHYCTEICSDKLQRYYDWLLEHSETFDWPSAIRIVRIKLPYKKEDIYDIWKLDAAFDIDGHMYFTFKPLWMDYGINCEPYTTIAKYINDHSTKEPILL